MVYRVYEFQQRYCIELHTRPNFALLDGTNHAVVAKFFESIGLDVSTLAFAMYTSTHEHVRSSDLVATWPDTEPIDIVLCVVDFIDSRSLKGLCSVVVRDFPTTPIAVRDMYQVVLSRLFAAMALPSQCELAQIVTCQTSAATIARDAFPLWAIGSNRGIKTPVSILSTGIDTIATQCTIHCNAAVWFDDRIMTSRRDDPTFAGTANQRLLVSYPWAVKLMLDAGFRVTTSPVREAWIETLGRSEFCRVFRVLSEMQCTAIQALAIATMYTSNENNTPILAAHKVRQIYIDSSSRSEDIAQNKMRQIWRVYNKRVHHVYPCGQTRLVEFCNTGWTRDHAVVITDTIWEKIRSIFAYDDYIPYDDEHVVVTVSHIYALTAEIVATACVAFYKRHMTYPTGLIEYLRANVDTTPFGAIADTYERNLVTRNAYGDTCDPASLPPIHALASDLRTPPCLAIELVKLDKTKYAHNETMKFMAFALRNIGYEPETIVKHIADAFDGQETLPPAARDQVRAKPRQNVEREVGAFFARQYKATSCTNEPHCPFRANATRIAACVTPTDLPVLKDIEDLCARKNKSKSNLSTCYTMFNKTVRGARGQSVRISNPVDYFKSATLVTKTAQERGMEMEMEMK